MSENDFYACHFFIKIIIRCFKKKISFNLIRNCASKLEVYFRLEIIFLKDTFQPNIKLIKMKILHNIPEITKKSWS